MDTNWEKKIKILQTLFLHFQKDYTCENDFTDAARADLIKIGVTPNGCPDWCNTLCKLGNCVLENDPAPECLMELETDAFDAFPTTILQHSDDDRLVTN